MGTPNLTHVKVCIFGCPLLSTSTGTGTLTAKLSVRPDTTGTQFSGSVGISFFKLSQAALFTGASFVEPKVLFGPEHVACYHEALHHVDA
jgi:hypothetical protein